VTNLLVSEIFGPTIQGEGVSTGRHAVFVRLGQCNLRCTWCDTPYTWAYTDSKAAAHIEGKKYDKDVELHSMLVEDVVSEVYRRWQKLKYVCPTTVVITGGEPLLQGPAIVTFVQELQAASSLFVPVEVETAGTILPPRELFDMGIQWNVSPKLSHSGNSVISRYKPDVLAAFVFRPAVFKFVVQGIDDFDEIEWIVAEAGIRPGTIWIMPEGRTTDQLIETGRKIMPEVLSRGYNFSYRLHTLLWGNERGH
jgi:7-carboxy-7-deazaguanine synthase